LLKVISERPSLWEPSARRDEGVDEHPQLKNNAAIGFHRPEFQIFTAKRLTPKNPKFNRFGKDFWQTV